MLDLLDYGLQYSHPFAVNSIVFATVTLQNAIASLAS